MLLREERPVRQTAADNVWEAESGPKVPRIEAEPVLALVQGRALPSLGRGDQSRLFLCRFHGQRAVLKLFRTPGSEACVALQGEYNTAPDAQQHDLADIAAVIDSKQHQPDKDLVRRPVLQAVRREVVLAGRVQDGSVSVPLAYAYHIDDTNTQGELDYCFLVLPLYELGSLEIVFE